MARRISFGGLSIRIPGAYSRVDATAMTPNTLGSINTVGILGTSVGGPPNRVLPYTSPSAAESMYVGGEMLDAMKLAWSPSADSLGAYEIYACRVGDDIYRSEVTLKNTNGDDIMVLKSRNYGAFTNNLVITIQQGGTPSSPNPNTRKISISNATSDDVPETNIRDLGYVLTLTRNDQWDDPNGSGESVATWDLLLDNNSIKVTLHTTNNFGPSITHVEFELEFSNQLFNTVYKIADYIKRNFGSYYSVKIEGESSISRDLDPKMLDNLNVTGLLPAGSQTITAYVHSVAEWINANSSLVYVDEVLGWPTSDPAIYPVELTVDKRFQGGSDGTVTNSSWENAISLFEGTDVQLIIAVTDDIEVQLALQSHVQYMSGQGRSERRAFYGHPVGDSIDEILERAIALSSDRASLWTPGIAFSTDENGDPDIKSSVYLGAIACGMCAGLAPQVPLTGKQVAILDIERNYLDSEILQLLDGGVAPVRFNRSRNFYQIVQGQTTWLRDENTLFKEISVGRIADFISINMRQILEAKFVGSAAETGTEERIRVEVVSQLKELLKIGVITNYGDVRVRIENTIAYVEYEVAPTEPINFILITTRFVPSRLST